MPARFFAALLPLLRSARRDTAQRRTHPRRCRFAAARCKGPTLLTICKSACTSMVKDPLHAKRRGRAQAKGRTHGIGHAACCKNGCLAMRTRANSGLGRNSAPGSEAGQRARDGVGKKCAHNCVDASACRCDGAHLLSHAASHAACCMSPLAACSSRPALAFTTSH